VLCPAEMGKINGLRGKKTGISILNYWIFDISTSFRNFDLKMQKWCVFLQWI